MITYGTEWLICACANHNIMAEPRVEVLYDAKTLLGEGPFYDHETGELIYVDIAASTVNFLTVETLQHRQATTASPYHTCVPS